jgi:putative transposase
MTHNSIDKPLKKFLTDIFYATKPNSPYQTGDFARVLTDAADRQDFVNNTSMRLGGPTGETVFARLKGVDIPVITAALLSQVQQFMPQIRRLLRNRNVALAFDTTDDPYYGSVEGLWIHPYCEAPGSTGCFKYITVSIVDRKDRCIVGCLPVRRGEYIEELIMMILDAIQHLVRTTLCLFDRGFDNYRLVALLKQRKLCYQILWRKDKWTKPILKSMKRGEIHEVIEEKKYTHNKTKHRVKIRFVFIKKYRRFHGQKAYDWVFVTNIRYKQKYQYVDSYRMRWGVETVFRILDTVRIKTTTKSHVIRYFLNAFCCLLYNLWKVLKTEGYEVSFKNFVAVILQQMPAIKRRPILLAQEKKKPG